MGSNMMKVAKDAKQATIRVPAKRPSRNVLNGLCEDDLLPPRPDDRLCCLINDEVFRTQELFDSGWRVWDSLEEDGQPMFSMIWRTYRRLLQRIADDPRAVATRRVRLSRSERIGLVSQHFFPPFFRRLPVPPHEVATL